MVLEIRRFRESDWVEVWSILEPVFRAGETYAFSPEISEAEAHYVWIEAPRQTCVAAERLGGLLEDPVARERSPMTGAGSRSAKR